MRYEKLIIDRSELLEKYAGEGLNSVLGSSDSKKIVVNSVVIEVTPKERTLEIDSDESSVVGWTNDGNAIYVNFESVENGNRKVGIYDFQKKQFKFALFPSKLLTNAYLLSGFSDLGDMVVADHDSDAKIWNYYILNIDKAKEIKLPFTTEDQVTTIPIENY